METQWIKGLVKAVLPRKFFLDRIQRPILEQQARVAAFWKPIITEWAEGKLPHWELKRKVDLDGKTAIWQYWGQGTRSQDLPEVVRMSFASIDHYCSDYTIIRLSDSTIHEYLDLPPFVYQRLTEKGGYTRTFFSDLLRLALLATYGGVWLDATILLTGPIPTQYTECGFFAFQRDNEEQQQLMWRSSYYTYWGWDERYRVRLLNSILFAHQGHEIVSAMLDMILYYWESQSGVIDYFFFQILFHELVQVGPLRSFDSPELVSDVIPHLLQKKLGSPQLITESVEDIMARYPMHKLTYFGQEDLGKLRAALQAYRPEIHWVQ